MEEEWRDVGIIDGIDYTGLYQCSNTGLVRSLNYGRTGKIELLNQQQHKNGYLFVGLWKSMNNKCISVIGKSQPYDPKGKHKLGYCK